MKKIKKLLIPAFLLLYLFVLVACSSEKTPINVEDFYSVMQDEGFFVTDVTNQFNESDVSEVIVASNGNYQLEMFVFENKDTANANYNYNVNLFEAQKGSSSSYNSKKFKNYSTYNLSSNEKFYTISQVENTFIYAVVDSEYKKEVQELFGKFGY